MKVAFRICFKLFTVLMPFFIVCPLLVGNFPMRFLDEDYAMYLQNREYRKSHKEYTRVLLMGDSVAKAAWYPKELSDDTYNFALGGASPIEEYYYLRDYLEHNAAPEYLIYMQSAGYLCRAQFLLARSAYFHTIDEEDLWDFAAVTESYDDRIVSEVIGLRNIKNEIIFYKTYSPVKYITAFIRGLFDPGRYKENKSKHDNIVETRGQAQFGTAECCDIMNYYVDYTEYHPNVILDMYFRRIIELCRETGIQFVFLGSPLNKSTYDNLQEQFVIDYQNYLGSVQKAYPEARIDKNLYCYDNCYFGDHYHFNMKGTIKFSREMKQKYTDIFVPES